MSNKKHFVRREHFINKLRERKFKFHRSGTVVDLWRQKGGPKRKTVPKRDLIPEVHVICSLQQCGCDKDEVKAFLRDVGS